MGGPKPRPAAPGSRPWARVPTALDELPTVVILRADRAASYGAVRRALAAAQDKGFAHFSLVVLRSRAPMSIGSGLQIGPSLPGADGRSDHGRRRGQTAVDGAIARARPTKSPFP